MFAIPLLKIVRDRKLSLHELKNKKNNRYGGKD